MLLFTRRRTLLALLALLGWAAPGSAQTVEPWATYRGNLQRTANTDGLAGPAEPKVLWVYKSDEHFVASPVPVGDRLVLSGLGAFNVATFSCLSTEPGAKERVLWSKSTPFLKLPTVSSPSVFAGKLVFGDGMHQTDGATLYCLDADKGMPLWRHGVPGKLVHLEGSPTIVAGRAYIGGGAAGVLCVEADRAAVAGKSLELPALQQAMADAWKGLQAKYAAEKKANPMFAMPPGEDQLPASDPKRVWQRGQDKWHVDAPVAVVGDKVLAGSAFLDKEKVGDRALHCLDARTGKELWRTPLKLNPWGGASVHGDTVVVTGSTIGYYPNQLKGAQGFVAAYGLADGKEKWLKTVTGGVVGCAALADGAVIATATDGKVRAFDLATGDRRWIYEAKSPLFAPAAVAKNTVYAGDLKGVVHAVDLKTGQKQWTLDLGAHPQTQAPGMVYGGPIVHGGRVYVATSNLEGPHARKATVVVCIGEK